MSTRKSKSPGKQRPEPAGAAKVTSARILAHGYLATETVKTFNIINELNGKDIECQDCQIENERLKTTCYTLNNKLSLQEDLIADNESLLKRVAENEEARKQLETANALANKRILTLEAENGTMRKDLSAALKSKNELQKQLDDATDYIINMEEKVYKSNRISLELLKQLKDAEMEIQILQAYIIDLKSRIAIYIPVKDDVIDNKLAEFINNYPERSKLKIMFMRESDGVYQFGGKKVAVKVEKGQIKIRVGGGYLSIDEFLDQYTPQELEKLERKDPILRFS